MFVLQKVTNKDMSRISYGEGFWISHLISAELCLSRLSEKLTGTIFHMDMVLLSLEEEEEDFVLSASDARGLRTRRAGDRG